MTMPAPGENSEIDVARLWDGLMEMVKVGPDVAGRAMGLDRIGLMFARRRGECTVSCGARDSADPGIGMSFGWRDAPFPCVQGS